MKRKIMFVALVAICGCVSVGRKIDQTKIEQITAGKTTRNQVVKLIGSPDQITTTAPGNVIFNYVFIHSTPKASTFIPVIGAFAGGANVQNQTLIITFTNDIVSSMINSYGGSEMGTGANAATSADLPDTTENKRTK